MNKVTQAAQTVLKTCAGLKSGDSLLIAYDSGNDARVSPISSIAPDLGILLVKESIVGDITREPPASVASKMLENEVTLFCVNEGRTSLWGHSDAKAAACKKGNRVLFLTQQLDATPSPEDLYLIMQRSQKLGDILEKTSEIDLITDGNCKLNLKLAGRKSLRLSSILTLPGNWGAVPDYSESAIAPLETESNGAFRADGMIVGLGKVDSPVHLQFDHGNLTKISGGRVATEFQNLLNTYGPSARVLCELGFGTNHLRKEVKGEFDDKKILGAAHVALGDNHTFGGKNRSDLHVDCMAVKPEVYFDGERFDFTSI